MTELDPYFRDFWIVTDKAKTLYPKLIVNQDTGIARYQLLAKGSNDKADGDETTDALEAVSRFLRGESLRFAAPGEQANRFDLNGGHVESIGMTPNLWSCL
jgi:hypothetical protein